MTGKKKALGLAAIAAAGAALIAKLRSRMGGGPAAKAQDEEPAVGSPEA